MWGRASAKMRASRGQAMEEKAVKRSSREYFVGLDVQVRGTGCRINLGQRTPVWIAASKCNRERCMRKSSRKFLALSLLSAVLVAAPVIKAYAAGGDEPSKPPATDTSTKGKKK